MYWSLSHHISPSTSSLSNLISTFLGWGISESWAVFYETSFPPSHAQPTGLPPTIAAVIIQSDCQQKHQTRDSSKHVPQATKSKTTKFLGGSPGSSGWSSQSNCTWYIIPLIQILWFPNPLLHKKNRNCSATSPPFDPFKNPREPF